MKGIKMLTMLLLVMVIAGNRVMAQDEIADSDLRKYAVLNLTINYMKKDISIELNKLIKAQEGFTGSRYKELSAAKGDETKLADSGVTEFEIKVLANISKMVDGRKDAIKETNSTLAKKMVGNNGKTYNKIKAALKEDEGLKARYETILAEVSGKE